MGSLKVALVGLERSGRSTIFRSVGGSASEAEGIHVANVKAPDSRLDKLAETYKPPKVAHTDIDFVDISHGGRPEQKAAGFSPQIISELRSVDALIIVVRAFENPSVVHPSGSIDPLRDARDVEAELVLNDLIQVEKRLERIEKERAEKAEKEALLAVKKLLEETKPLRLMEMTAVEERILGGFNFLSRKPAVLLVNISESDIGKAAYPELEDFASANRLSPAYYCAEAEKEISELEPEEQLAFLRELGLERPGRERLIQEVFRLLHMIVFLTIGDTEVRAWLIPEGTNALKAAGKVHSDIERGFIRAEVVHFPTFLEAGSIHAAKEAGLLRLEGKEYVVQDGDIIKFRFHV